MFILSILLAICCVLHTGFSFYCLFQAAVHNEIMVMVIGAMLLILYGAFASLYTARRVDTSLSRRERMERQCGHTAMLIYFWNLGPLVEMIQICRNMGNMKALLNACITHYIGECIFQTLFRYFFDLPIMDNNQNENSQTINLGALFVTTIMLVGAISLKRYEF